MSKTITKTNNDTNSAVKWPRYLVFLFTFIFIVGATVTILGFINQPLYNNFRMMSSVQIAMIAFEVIMLIAVPFYIYTISKTKAKHWLIHSILMGLSLTIFFVNIIGFILMPVLVVGYIALKGKAKWYTKLLSGFGVFLLSPIYLVGIIFGVAMATVLSDSDVKSYQIASDASETDKVQKATDYNIATWNVGYAGTGSEMSYFYDEGENGPGKYGKNWEIGQDDAHLEGVRQFIKAGIGTSSSPELNYYDSLTKGITAKPALKWNFGTTGTNPHGKLDFVFVQEVDKPSVRSFYQDQTKIISNMFNKDKKKGHGYDVNFVNNLKVNMLPVPLFDPIGQVDAGVLTASRFHMENQKRIWLKTKGVGIKSFFNLKRAINYTEYKVDGGKKLIMANVHMSAFPEDKEKRIKELNVLKKLLIEWNKAGNYIVVGGDWNTDIANVFKTASNSHFPNKEQNGIWAYDAQGQMTNTAFTKDSTTDSNSIYSPVRDIKAQYGMMRPLAKLSVPFYRWLMQQRQTANNGFKFAVDATLNHASNRFTDQKWSGAAGTVTEFDSKGSIIDGFLVSDNVHVSKITTLQQGWHKNPYNKAHPYLFADSDHNPSIMKFSLK